RGASGLPRGALQRLCHRHAGARQLDHPLLAQPGQLRAAPGLEAGGWGKALGQPRVRGAHERVFSSSRRRRRRGVFDARPRSDFRPSLRTRPRPQTRPKPPHPVLADVELLLQHPHARGHLAGLPGAHGAHRLHRGARRALHAEHHGGRLRRRRVRPGVQGGAARGVGPASGPVRGGVLGRHAGRHLPLLLLARG
ncbi:hypothetical protein H632_c5314p0, partial [Helicosporidium sp. ATCC 50920]